jgi:hypothetical protein
VKGKESEGWLDRLLLSSTFWYVLPTPAIFLLNRKRVTAPAKIGALPPSEWSRRERRKLLQASEARLQSIESKGPGVVTVTAVVAAGVLIALANGWNEAGLLGKLFLVLATFYSALSLLTPIYLVGPLKRHVVDVPELEQAAADADPDEWLATTSANEAMRNDLQNRRLANHLDAARREVAYALGLLLCWAVLAVSWGVFENPSSPGETKQSAPETSRPLHPDSNPHSGRVWVEGSRQGDSGKGDADEHGARDPQSPGERLDKARPSPSP